MTNTERLAEINHLNDLIKAAANNCVFWCYENGGFPCGETDVFSSDVKAYENQVIALGGIPYTDSNVELAHELFGIGYV